MPKLAKTHANGRFTISSLGDRLKNYSEGFKIMCFVPSALVQPISFV